MHSIVCTQIDIIFSINILLQYLFNFRTIYWKKLNNK